MSAATALPLEPRTLTGAVRAPVKSTVPSWLFTALLAYYVLEYLRPPLLQALKLQMLFLLLVPMFWFMSKDRPWSRNLTLMGVFIVLGIAMVPFAHNYFSVYMNTRIMFGNMMIALACTLILSRRREFTKAMAAFVVIMCLQAIWAMTHSGHGHGAFMEDENDLALACLLAFPFAFLGFQVQKGRTRWLCLIATVILLAGIVVSSSRGGFVGLVATGLYCVLAGRNRVRNIVLGLLAGLIFFVVIPSTYKSEMSTISNTQSGTAEERLFLWTAAVNMWMDHPINGVGPYNAKWHVGEYQPGPTKGGLFTARHFTERDWTMKALHSVYFELLADRGLIGCVLFGMLAVGHFTGLRRLRKDLARAAPSNPELALQGNYHSLSLAAAMIGYLSAGAFLSVTYYGFFWHFTALAVALDRACRQELRAAAPPTS